LDDAEYIFKQTNSERKRTGRGAIAKKNGSKSKKCSLPSDYLTPSEIKKLNGECVTYDLSKPMGWAEFKSMSHDLRAEYIQKLIKMGAGRSDIADMFRITPDQYSQFMVKKHRGEKFMSNSPKRRNNDEFVAWFLGEKYTPEEQKPAEEQVSQEKPEKKKESKPEKKRVEFADLCEGTFAYVGHARAIFEQILTLMSETDVYNISVTFQKSAIGICAQSR